MSNEKTEPTEKVAATTAASETHDAEAQDSEPKTLADAIRELSEMRAALKEVNNESAQRRKKLKAFEDAEAKRIEEEKKRSESELSEAARLKKQLDEATQKLTQAEQQARSDRLRHAVESAARDAQLDMPQDVFGLVRDDKALLELIKDEDGVVNGVEDALKAFVKKRPSWPRKGAASSVAAVGVNTNATARGKTDVVLDDNQINDLRQKFGIRI